MAGKVSFNDCESIGTLGENVEGFIQKDGKKETLLVAIDLSENLGESHSGKTEVCATTRGFSRIMGTDISLSLNATLPLSKKR